LNGYSITVVKVGELELHYLLKKYTIG
jgi:hypothetical protein